MAEVRERHTKILMITEAVAQNIKEEPAEKTAIVEARQPELVKKVAVEPLRQESSKAKKQKLAPVR